MSGLFRALRGRAFALVWSGHSISLFGDRIFQVALAWWVLEETGSALVMGTVFIVTTIPMLLFLLVGGVMVDRFPRIWLMLFSDVVRGVVVAVFALLAFTDALAIWHVFVLSLISGFVEAFFQPAYRAVIPEVVPEGDLPSANSLSSLSGQFSGIVGPAAGAALVALGGTPLAFTLDAASFFVSGLCLLPILKLATSPQAETETSTVLGDLREGVTAVTGTPWLWITIAIAGVSNIAYAGPMEVVLPFLIADYHQADVGVLGLFYSAASVGSVIGAIWLGRLPKLRRRGVTLYGAWMISGLMVTLIGLPIPIVIILISSLVRGVGESILALVWVNILQERVPRRLLGRVTSIDYLGSFIFLPLGYGIGGWAAEIIGASLVFVIGGLLQAGIIGLGLLHRDIRTLD